MLRVKELLAHTKTHRPVLLSNASQVMITFKPKNRNGKDVFGYYHSVSGSALTRAKGKKTKYFEIRLYWGGRGKTMYIPPELRKKGIPYIGPIKPPLFTIETKVWVTCSCEYNLYHCEVANEEEDSSSMKYSNGMGPNITNPQHIAHLCKHLIQSLRRGALLKV